MKDPIQVLRMKELEMSRVRREVEALQIAVRLLSEETIPSNGHSPERLEKAMIL